MMDMLITVILSVGYMILGAGSAQNFPPPLNKEEEARLFSRLREHNDYEARCLLIEHNLRLVSHIVRKYYSTQKCQDDLVSIGSIGLIKAVDSFNPESGTKFATYAARCIQNDILMFFRSQKKTQSEVSMNETIDIDKDGNPLTYIDIIKCDDTIADDLDRRLCIEKAMAYITGRLNPREREIMIMRYGIGGGKALTQRETAEKLGISRSYVSRIEKGCLEKLCTYLS